MENNIKNYRVMPLKNQEHFDITVPGSKSITNRALLLSALGKGSTHLSGVLFSDDSRVFLNCLKDLGFSLNINEELYCVDIKGTGGRIPNTNASIYVGSAGTAARFLTVFLAFAGGDYTLNASSQMCKRPMEPLITSLREAGVSITCTGEEGHFPFTMHSEGISVSEMHTNTDISSQFASAMLMASPLISTGLKIVLEGNRTEGAYIKITLRMMEQFGISFEKKSNVIEVKGGSVNSIEKYDIEPDVSAAGYFYAMSPICHKSILVKGVHPDSMQGDISFIKNLTNFGCQLRDTPEGLLCKPADKSSYEGLDINMNDFSDQTMTMAVVLAFATSPSCIRGIKHIRFQESDRMMAIINELNRVGLSCSMTEDEDGICIVPGPMHGADIETYEDHRMAMAFSLLGLRIPDINILNPMCCSKTFENYFEILNDICDH